MQSYTALSSLMAIKKILSTGIFENKKTANGLCTLIPSTWKNAHNRFDGH